MSRFFPAAWGGLEVRLFPGFRYRRALGSPLFWAWIGLSVLPPDVLGWVFGWGAADPLGLAFGVLWWPADLFGRLAALNLLLRLDTRPAAPSVLWRSALAVLGSALTAEVLVTVRATALVFLGLLPCLLLLSLSRPEALEHWPLRAALLLTAGLGLLPAAFYLLRRCLSSLELLRGHLSGSEALDASARRLQGPFLWRFLKFAWPWMALSWALSGLSMLLPLSLGWLADLAASATALLPLALASDL